MLRKEEINKAVDCIKSGQVIAYPTEAVFGLGCDPLNEKAVMDLLSMKQRPLEKGLILIAADFQQLAKYVEPIADEQMQTVLETWPGPHTWIFPVQPWVPEWIRGKHQSIAVRVTDHPVVIDICHALNAAIISTSANISDKPAAVSIDDIHQQFAGQIPYIIDAPLGGLDRPTQIRDARSGQLLRV